MSRSYDEMVNSKQFLPFWIGYLTDDLIVRARKELGETDEIRNQALKEMKKLVRNERNFVCWTHDEFLLQYLRARKFDVKNAFAVLKNSFRAKQDYPEIYDRADKDAIRNVMSCRIITCLPYRDKDGCVLIIIRPSLWDPDINLSRELLSAMTCLIMHSVCDPATQVCGIRFLYDARDLSLRHIRNFPIRYIHLIAKALKNILPVRLKGIDFYNESPFLSYIYSILKIFLMEKIRKRVRFHGDSQESLHTSIPKEILPTEYGGNYVDFETSNFSLKEVERYLDTFVEIHNLGYKD